jgi:long-chain acyl-CoA synthetase
VRLSVGLVCCSGATTTTWPIELTHPPIQPATRSGQSGVVMMKGPQAMGGYKANAEASKKAFDSEGFLDTGDLGRINPGTGHLIITGRAKVC